VKKKGGQIRICMDFKDLNRACLKDEFPPPNVDILVDAAGHDHFFLLWMAIVVTTIFSWSHQMLIKLLLEHLLGISTIR